MVSEIAGIEILDVCTRTRLTDYRFLGDSGGGDFYDTLGNGSGISGIPSLIETTRPAVLYLDDSLYVTGIPSSRKDRVGTPIHWSFYCKFPEARDFFQPLRKAFGNSSIAGLGDCLDRICNVSASKEDFLAPKHAMFAACLRNCLEPDDGDGKPETSFELWTDFRPTPPEKLEEFIDSLDMPEGKIHITGCPVIYKKKDSRILAKLLKTGTALLLVTGTLLGAKYLQDSDAPKTGLENGREDLPHGAAMPLTSQKPDQVNAAQLRPNPPAIGNHPLEAGTDMQKVPEKTVPGQKAESQEPPQKTDTGARMIDPEGE